MPSVLITGAGRGIRAGRRPPAGGSWLGCLRRHPRQRKRQAARGRASTHHPGPARRDRQTQITALPQLKIIQCPRQSTRAQPSKTTKEVSGVRGHYNFPSTRRDVRRDACRDDEAAGPSVDGLLVHIGRATTDGFQIVEVWESKEQYDRAHTDIEVPLMRELAGDQLPPSTELATETFDVHGLVIPNGNILI
jgi:hypothetical protein